MYPVFTGLGTLRLLLSLLSRLKIKDRCQHYLLHYRVDIYILLDGPLPFRLVSRCVFNDINSYSFVSLLPFFSITRLLCRWKQIMGSGDRLLHEYGTPADCQQSVRLYHRS